MELITVKADTIELNNRETNDNFFFLMSTDPHSQPNQTKQLCDECGLHSGANPSSL